MAGFVMPSIDALALLLVLIRLVPTFPLPPTPFPPFPAPAPGIFAIEIIIKLRRKTDLKWQKSIRKENKIWLAIEREEGEAEKNDFLGNIDSFYGRIHINGKKNQDS